ncbi:hypothetical protein SAMN06265222_106183 [Neorhodopirellula lusitana]|uniref:DUF883 domain-containing protein n=1 Tax=Neorhodopirellula lusitana TaxID=445327 RepID=A0ABY1Q511_9BACT|nr:hypothetical protein [Neorhodopirellula lusitana]SMP59204.1 hypothetical protein SAMN06265222_106183 [Neorhodopirellula lusitana]
MIAEAEQFKAVRNQSTPDNSRVWSVGRTPMHAQHLEEASGGLSERATDVVGRYPIVSLAAAAAIGLAAGWLVKRSHR